LNSLYHIINDHLDSFRIFFQARVNILDGLGCNILKMCWQLELCWAHHNLMTKRPFFCLVTIIHLVSHRTALRSILWIETLQMVADDQISDRKKFALTAIFTANFWLFANSPNPFIATDRLITLFTRFLAFKAPGIDIFGVDPVKWTVVGLGKGVKNAQKPSTLSGRISPTNPGTDPSRSNALVVGNTAIQSKAFCHHPGKTLEFIQLQSGNQDAGFAVFTAWFYHSITSRNRCSPVSKPDSVIIGQCEICRLFVSRFQIT